MLGALRTLDLRKRLFGRRRRLLLGGPAVLVVAAISMAVLAAGRGAGSATPSATPHRGWIHHELVRIRQVPYPGAGFYATQKRERWWVVDDVCRSREIYYPMLSMDPVESSVDERPGSIHVWAYDASLNHV